MGSGSGDVGISVMHALRSESRINNQLPDCQMEYGEEIKDVLNAETQNTAETQDTVDGIADVAEDVNTSEHITTMNDVNANDSMDVAPSQNTNDAIDAQSMDNASDAAVSIHNAHDITIRESNGNVSWQKVPCMPEKTV